MHRLVHHRPHRFAFGNVRIRVNDSLHVYLVGLIGLTLIHLIEIVLDRKVQECAVIIGFTCETNGRRRAHHDL
jgi:hypothetical protein